MATDSTRGLDTDTFGHFMRLMRSEAGDDSQLAGYRHAFAGTAKALFVDYDGSLRETVGGGNYPADPRCRRPDRSHSLRAAET